MRLKLLVDYTFLRRCRERLNWDVLKRIEHGFVSEHIPVRDDCTRAFATMADYRDWCEKNVPPQFGYHRPKKQRNA